MATRWIEANGVQLRYALGGNGKGAGTIVLVHEMGGALESWDAVVPLLARRSGVLRYDQRGAGLSEKPRTPLTVEDAAHDLAGLLDALRIEPPVAVVGAAVGAAVAATFAALHADRLQALVLLAPATALAGDRKTAAERRIETIERLGIRSAFADEPSGPRRRYEQIRMAADPVGLAATWRMLAGLDMAAAFAAISCPTLVLAGRRDTARPPDHVAGIAARIAGAEFAVLDTGHVMAIDTPRPVALAVLDFLDRKGFGQDRSGLRAGKPID